MNTQRRRLGMDGKRGRRSQRRLRRRRGHVPDAELGQQRLRNRHGDSMKRLLLLLCTIAALGAAAPAAALAAAPSGVTAMALDGRVEVAWQAEPGATGYKVYRGASP